MYLVKIGVYTIIFQKIVSKGIISPFGPDDNLFFCPFVFFTGGRKNLPRSKI